MDINDFSKLIQAKRRELYALMRRRMPVIAGRMAKDHFQDNFRKGGFVNGGLHPWPKTVRQRSGGTSAAGSYGPLLSGRKHLFHSLKYTPGYYRVTVADELVYAPVHNWGGTVSVSVTDRMRRFAWAKFYKAAGKAVKSSKGKKDATRQSVNEQARFWHNLALTKKTKLNIRIPQRQFLGESSELSGKLNKRAENEINSILNN